MTRTASVSVPAVSTGFAVVQCQTGERATGGGGGLPAGAGTRILVQSGPVNVNGSPTTSGTIPTGWRVNVDNTTGVGLNAVANAICVAP